MDKELINRRFSGAVASYESEAVVQRQVAHTLAQKIAEVGVIPNAEVVEIGCGTGMLSREIVQRFSPNSLLLNDLSPQMEGSLQELLSTKGVSFIAEDAERIEMSPNHYDLIASSSTVQWFAEPARFIDKCHMSLREGAILAIATYGEQNFRELRELGQPALPYTDLHPLIAQKFRVVEHSCEIIEMSFDSPIEVLRHLKKTGANAIKAEGWSKGKLKNFCEEYYEKFRDPETNKITLSYNPIYIIAKK